MKSAIVAGHICLDIIPALSGGVEFVPGKLMNVGAATLATGGAVSNTGRALHRLGASVRLLGKVGDDLLGRAVLDVLRVEAPALAEAMIVARGESSSYTLVLSPPGVDRMFLHHPGANDTFCASDVPDDALHDAALFHFGYPPLMRRIFEDDGRELETLLRRVKACGLTTSLDMAMPDPDSLSGRVDWPALLTRVLPQVDVFLPSWDELCFMLEPVTWQQLAAAPPKAAMLRDLAGRLLDMGAAVIIIKLGERGLFARVTSDAARLRDMDGCAPCDVSSWRGREAWQRPFTVQVVGTTGAGDASIAGFLWGLLCGFSLDDCLQAAAATGACCCEAPDATSGVPCWSQIAGRLQGGWQHSDHI